MPSLLSPRYSVARIAAIVPRTALLGALAAALLSAGGASAQDWAKKMFEKVDHDFGTVARGSDTVYKFEVKNIYKEDVELESVRSSCGCTTPSLEGKLIKTYDKAYVVAQFNTRTFTGLHSATLTVQISKPYRAQVQLRVHGNIRADVVFSPGSVDFGVIDQGATTEKTVGVTYAGRSGWKIEDVRAASDALEVELTERQRSSNRVAYDLLVRMRETAPAGLLSQQLVLVTNDSSAPRIPIDVTARIKPELTAAPENLVFGDVPHGDTVAKKLIVRGKRPFKVESVTCEREGFAFEVDNDEPAIRHLIDVEFNSTGKAGAFRSPVVIATDLGESFTASVNAYATVVASEEPDSAAEADNTTQKTAQNH
ncbi:hypothetical protein Mal64_11210 [Pseudobythopirellula maris]|uniref:DUF1573 domain-containing protein n=1 Tax=Pseudobythopirellula maris TaxID=2527991 RepID=A0A5C5ZU50_9BACT|nr:DUF1573 domain-containing protein [Pseudobythopirellula maris]TWT90726.1 hypothetical protein Mal64_11210 [Pseudobythopirellula maris]